jgi:hypothetical protein
VGHTDGGGLDHVADGESLDRLVLGGASRAVGAADGLDVATTLLVTTAGILLALPHLQVQQLRSWAVHERVPTWMRAS